MGKVISDKECWAEVQFHAYAFEIVLRLTIAGGRISVMLRNTVEDMHCLKVAVHSPCAECC